MITAAPADLAGHHHGKDAKVGCIACHGGADLPMRLTVWTVAGIDTLKFLSGAYGEPTHMRLPLRDVECRQCHTPILPTARRPGAAGTPRVATAPSAAAAPGDESAAEAEAESEGRGGTSYHAIREHDTVRVACVHCHTSHTTDSTATDRFLAKGRVVPVCRDCHKQM